MSYIDRIRTKNHVSEVRRYVLPFAQRIARRPGVVGVVLLGGVADTPYRSFLDSHSDIDLVFFLDVPEAAEAEDIKEFCHAHPDLMPDWSPEFSFYLPIPCLASQPMEVNVHQLIYQYEQQRHVRWTESKREAYAYTSEVISDPRGFIRQLIEEKTAMDPRERWNRLVVIAGQIPWNVAINPLRQISRGFLMNGHDLLNEGLSLFIEALYLYNKRYRPHFKWRLEMSCDLPWTPPDYRSHLTEVQRVLDQTADDIRRRSEALWPLWLDLRQQLEAEGLPADPFHYASVHLDPDRQVRVTVCADVVAAVLQGRDGVDLDRIRALINFTTGSVSEFIQRLESGLWDPDVLALFNEEIRTLEACVDRLKLIESAT